VTAHERHFVLAAGGTGGHVVPAHAVGEALRARGHLVSLVTDERTLNLPGLFANVPRHVIDSGTPGRGGLRGLVAMVPRILAGRSAALRLFDSYPPTAVIGFGGYPSLPALLAALKLKLPTLVHEQNAVLGRVNRLLARRVDAIATSYPDVAKVPSSARDKVQLTGNPVREQVLALRDEPFPDLRDDSILRVLVVGGSQGARVLSDVVPHAMTMLPGALRRRLQITQQCREEDIERVRVLYSANDIPADLATYIEDMDERLRWAHLVIARAGASTLTELAAAGRPSILVPLPGAMDNHQVHNCRELVEAGGARMIPERAFTPQELAKQIQKIALTPGALANAAARAHHCGRPDATTRLADLAERVAGVPARRSNGANGVNAALRGAA
jgi:UDP-N-acetylglucosamine--N-acetylmuramyl-(pentapeptide) pyrophosphoryl-undecaprenol N-acetylglucosamine transferase